MSEVFPVEKEQVENNGHSAMRELAEKEVAFHRNPLPEAEYPARTPFPGRLIAGLWIGVIAGAVLGYLFGYLLINFIWVIPGWEGLYSMAPSAFFTFWVLMGVALGILLVGIGAILLTPSHKDQ